MLIGLDLSRHNKGMKNPSAINDYDFIIVKATEGATYKDPALSFWVERMHPDMLKGFYHFARPDNNNLAKSEADNFLSATLKYIDGRSIIALDVEAGALSYKKLDDWCLKWCQYVHAATGITPMIYCSVSECKRFKKCAAWGCGLWVAKWSAFKPKNIAPWEFFAIWQKSNNIKVSGVRCDFNLFNGKVSQYLKYCRN